MAIIKCIECERKASITFCSESGEPLCGDCSVSCKACYKPLNRKKAHLTSTGRTLCTQCMAERNAQRKARKEHEAKARKRKKAAEAAGAAPAAASLSNLTADAPAKPNPKAESFASLTSDDPPAKPGASFSSLAADGDVDMMGSGAGAAPEDGDEDELDEAGRPKTYGLEGAAGEGSSRLELPPIDEHRPILNSSGYQTPSKLKYFLAFVFFGVAGVVFYSRSDVLHDIMWPYKTTGLQYNSTSQPLIFDDNRLRDTSNLNQLDLFSQAPIFFVTWAILITYLGGSALIVLSTIRSLISSTLAKRRLKRAEAAAEKSGYSYPG